MILQLEQTPQGVEVIDGKKTIHFSHLDNQIDLYCRPTKQGNMKVLKAEFFDYNEETEDWDISEDLAPEDGIDRFGYKQVLNPLTGNIATLI